MADIKFKDYVNSLTLADTLDGTEKLYVIQDGLSKESNINAIKTFITNALAPAIGTVTPSSGVYTFDLSAGNSFKTTLTSEATFVLSNPVANSWYNILVTQDVDGAHSITLPNNTILEINTGSAHAIDLSSQVGGGKNLIKLFYDGTNFWVNAFFAYS